MKAHCLLALCSAAALSACVAGPAPVIETPTPVLAEDFLFSPAGAEAGTLAALLPVDDPAYRALTDAAMAGSPTLAQAMARIDQARAAADRAGAERLPNLSLSTAITGTRTSPDQFGANLPAGIAIDTERVSYGTNMIASWDSDLFGRLRAQERAAQARTDAATYAAHAVRIALRAEIGGSVVDWRTLAAREARLQEDLAAAQELVRLTGVREAAGVAAGFDRIRAQSAADASRSRIAALANERARIIGRLVTLTAQNGADVVRALDGAAPEDSVPAPVAAAPSLLLQNRPDVAAAEARLRAADADLAATARRRFPSFSLSATVGLLAFAVGDLFSSDSVVGSLAGSVAAPLLDFGRIAADIDAAAAGKRIAFMDYRGAVYTALGEAETAYGLVAAADREAAAAAAEAASLARAARLASVRNAAGLSDFLTVLEARRSADASGERAAAAAGRARRARITLWQALGGEP